MARLRIPAFALAAAALWIALLRLPSMAPGASIDDSWYLAFAHFFKHRAQAGTEYVFTYGPLGYFMQPAYDADLFAAKYAWELIQKAIFTLVAFCFLARLRSWLARAACYLALLSFPVTADDAQYTWIVFLLGVLLVGRPEISPLLLAGAAVVLAVLGLVKFTLLLLAALVIAVLAADLVANRRLPKALLVVGSFSLALALGWILAGQRLGNFPRYLGASWDISTGYTDAMSVSFGRTVELVAAVAVLALWAATLVSRRPWPGTRLPNALRLLLTIFVAYLSWKNGFVRHDIHAASFFALALLLTFVFPVAFEGFVWRSPLRLPALLGAGVLSLVGLGLVISNDGTTPPIWRSPDINLRRGARGLLDASGLEARLEKQQAHHRVKARLPRLRQIVGDEPVDVFGNNQGPALLSGMNWRPRPVFQSYAAYTPRLAERNGAYFEGPLAPRYVLLSLVTIDDRFPTHEDGVALRCILAHYRPVAAERRHLLLERVAGSVREETRADASDVRFDQTILFASDDRALILRIDIEKSWLGKLASLILKPPSVALTIARSDGETWIYALVPPMARSGFLLHPLLLEMEDVIDAYTTGGPPLRVERCAVQSSWAGRQCYRSIHVAVDTSPALTAVRIGDDEAVALKRQLGARPEVAPR